MAVHLRLRRADLEEIYRQARAQHPEECCGILTVGARAEASSIHPCQNIQGRLHGEDPQEYPRDARIAYFIDPQEQFDIIATAERNGGGVSGFYHSHIDCDAYFSAEDRERAMAWDEPAYPDAVYLVVSVHADGVRGHKAFGWLEDTGDFDNVQIEILD